MILVFDTETTGLAPRNAAPSDTDAWDGCRIVQIAWEVYRADTRELVCRDQYIIMPDGYDIPARVAAIHGITTERAATEGVPIQTAFDALRAVLGDVRTVVAHNMWFDHRVLLSELFRYEQRDLVSAWCSKERACTMLMGTPPKGKWPKLVDLFTRLFDEAPNVTLHRADADVAICARCYFKMLPVSS